MENVTARVLVDWTELENDARNENERINQRQRGDGGGEQMAPTLSTPFRHIVIRRLGYTPFQNHPQSWSVVTSSAARLSHRLHSPSSMATPQASANPPPSSPTKTVKVVVKGRVQGVFFRNWTIENATQLGLKGWVRNRRDGSVEALFSGDPDSVQEMEQRCRRGPPDAVVTGFSVVPCNDDPGTGFQRKTTVCMVKIGRGGASVLRLVRKMLARVLTFSRSNFTITAAADDCEDDMGPLPEDVKEGHFVVQTVFDGELKRFVIDLGYLGHPGFLKLLELAEEEFGFEQEGVLAVPCGPSELLRILETQKEGSSYNR